MQSHMIIAIFWQHSLTGNIMVKVHRFSLLYSNLNILGFKERLNLVAYTYVTEQLYLYCAFGNNYEGHINKCLFSFNEILSVRKCKGSKKKYFLEV